ncbi:MAG TPA: hypothetical protein VLV15_04155 [Dongiaceae bacterium]|nr:hypothetical protein [Dongiaceae bacterium]
MTSPLTPASDPRREMPASSVARLDHVRAAVASLADEQRRLERLGLELPLARCHDQLRYWRFLDGLLTVAAGDTTRRQGMGAWPAVADR